MKKIFLILIFIVVIGSMMFFVNGFLSNGTNYSSHDFNTNVSLKRDEINASLSGNGSGVKFSMAAPKATFKKERNADIYEIPNGTEMKYEVLKSGTQRGLKETITLNDKNVPNEFTFDLTLENVKNFLPEPQQKSWLFYNEKGELAFYIPAGFMVDQKGTKSEDVKISITKKSINDYQMKVIADKDWLNDKDREYPVKIDPSVIVSGGFTETEAQFGSLQRKVVYVASNWYAFYTDGTDVLYQKSSDGVTWGSPVDVDTSDTDNFSPTVWLEGSLIYVGWIDDSTDALEVNTINTASGDALGTKCTGADQGTLDNTNVVSLAVADDGTVYLAYSDTGADTEHGVFKLVFSGCTFTDITDPSNLDSVSVLPSTGSGTSVTWSHTTSAAANLLVVQTEFDQTGSPTVASVTYNGDPLTFINSAQISFFGAPVRIEMWYMIAPDSGTHNVTINYSGNYENEQAAATSWIDINQSTPLGTSGTTTGSSGTASINISSNTGEIVLDSVVSSPLVDVNAPGSGQTQYWGEAGGDYWGGSYKSGASSTTMSWTLDGSTTWGIIGVPIKPNSIINPSGLTAGDRPVLVTIGNTLHMIYQDGNLSHSVFDGSAWTTSNATIASVTNNLYSVTTDGTDLWVLSVSGSTATNFYEYSSGSWSTKTAPWTGETNLTQASILYDSGADDLYAAVIKDSTEQAYWKSTDASSISWSGETSYGFTAGDLGQLSMPMSVTSATLTKAVLRQGSNFEFSGPTLTPTPTPSPTPTPTPTPTLTPTPPGPPVNVNRGVKIYRGTKIQRDP